MTKARLALASLLFALPWPALAGGASAPDDPAGGWMTKLDAGVTPPATSAAGGMRVFIDPQTHQPRRPEAEELQQLSITAPRASRAAPKVRTLASGALAAELDDGFASYLVATRQPDGTLRVDCLPATEAAAALSGARPKADSTAPKRVVDEQ
jgi:hypothetical protein